MIVKPKLNSAISLLGGRSGRRLSSRYPGINALAIDGNIYEELSTQLRSILAGQSSSFADGFHKYTAGEHIGRLQRHDVVGGQHAVEIGD